MQSISRQYFPIRITNRETGSIHESLDNWIRIGNIKVNLDELKMKTKCEADNNYL